MNETYYNERLAIIRAVAIETDRYCAQDEEQRDGWLDDALNNAYVDGITDNAWLLASGYVREVPHEEIIYSLFWSRTEGVTDVFALPWPNLYDKLEFVNGDSLPHEYHSRQELIELLERKGVVVELPA